MTLQVDVLNVALVEDLLLEVTVAVSSNENESYSGAISVANAPQSDNTEISGSLAGASGSFPGDSNTHRVVLDAGLTDDDLPTEVLITAALDDGTQEQATVEVSPDGGRNGNGVERDGLTSREWAAIGAGAVGTGYALNRLLDN